MQQSCLQVLKGHLLHIASLFTTVSGWLPEGAQQSAGLLLHLHGRPCLKLCQQHVQHEGILRKFQIT